MKHTNKPINEAKRRMQYKKYNVHYEDRIRWTNSVGTGSEHPLIGFISCTETLEFLSYIYTGCPRRNVPDFGRVFLMLKCTDITQNTYVQCGTVT